MNCHTGEKMKNTFSFNNFNYNEMTTEQKNKIFTVDRKLFLDKFYRDTSEEDIGGHEQYDNPRATYLTGVICEKIICSTQLIHFTYSSKVPDAFNRIFSEVEIPDGEHIEASRFIVDKNRLGQSGMQDVPVNQMLFLSMINYAMRFRYHAIYAIVSRQMRSLLRESGWESQLLVEGLSEQREKIYLISLPADNNSRRNFIGKLLKNPMVRGQMLYEWPLTFSLQ